MARAPAAELDPPDPHAPRRRERLYGHDGAEEAFAAAYTHGRLPHAWLLAGPEGVGKASFAFRAARWLLAGAPQARPGQGKLHVEPGHPVFRRVASGGHSDLFVLERGFNEKTGRLRTEIVIDDVRDAIASLRLTPGEGAWRILILDPAEALNRNAENALLKTLEEPKPNTLLLLVSHAPGQLLPTTRSRLRTLRFAPLDETAMEQALDGLLEREEQTRIAALARGSPGRAVALAQAGVAEVLPALEALLASMPGHDRRGALALADRLGRAEADAAFRAVFELLVASLAEAAARRARGRGVAGAGLCAPVAGAASLDALPLLWENLRRLGEDTLRANLDRKQAVLTALAWLDAAASGSRIESW